MVTYPMNDQFGYPQFNPVPSTKGSRDPSSGPGYMYSTARPGTEASSIYVFQQQQRPVRKNDLRRVKWIQVESQGGIPAGYLT